MKNELDFSYNWNNKLASLKAFTTLRLKNDNRFREGETYRITIKGKFLCYAEIRHIKNFLLKDINDYIAYLDTGYSAEECRKIITTMYKNKVRNWDIQQLSFILLIKIKNHAETRKQAGAGAEAPGLVDPGCDSLHRTNLYCDASA